MATDNPLTTLSILAAADRLPFSPRDRDDLDQHLLACRRDLGLALNVVDPDPDEMLAQGAITLKPLFIAETLLLVNVNAGRNLLGRPAARIYCFCAPLGQDRWTPLGCHGDLKAALAALTALYRPAGKCQDDSAQAVALEAGVPAR